MKTLIIYNDIESPLQFLIVDGDFSRFNGVMINSTSGTGFEDEFCRWMWDPETGERNHKWSEDTSLFTNKDWDKGAVVTFLP